MPLVLAVLPYIYRRAASCRFKLQTEVRTYAVLITYASEKHPELFVTVGKGANLTCFAAKTTHTHTHTHPHTHTHTHTHK